MFKYQRGLSEEERILKNISNISELRQGDLAYDRGLGVLPEWMDKQSGMYSAEVMSELTAMLNEREPRVTSEIEVDENNEMKIVVSEREDEYE